MIVDRAGIEQIKGECKFTDRYIGDVMAEHWTDISETFEKLWNVVGAAHRLMPNFYVMDVVKYPAEWQRDLLALNQALNALIMPPVEVHHCHICAGDINEGAD